MESAEEHLFNPCMPDSFSSLLTHSIPPDNDRPSTTPHTPDSAPIHTIHPPTVSLSP